ncbi:hypothetical protein CSTAT_09665 [Corynebacterium stationis]|nr:hypothetical protein CSTAT_09665 [Corynebacterium stationis]
MTEAVRTTVVSAVFSRLKKLDISELAAAVFMGLGFNSAGLNPGFEGKMRDTWALSWTLSCKKWLIFPVSSDPKQIKNTQLKA